MDLDFLKRCESKVKSELGPFSDFCLLKDKLALMGVVDVDDKPWA